MGWEAPAELHSHGWWTTGQHPQRSVAGRPLARGAGARGEWVPSGPGPPGHPGRKEPASEVGRGSSELQVPAAWPCAS